VRFAEENRREFEEQRRIAKEKKERPFRDDELASRKKLPFEDRVRRAKAGGGTP
jgi:hypothetical protein